MILRNAVLGVVCFFLLGINVNGVWGNDGTHRRIHVSILMYHYVGELPEDADTVRRGLTVSASQFRNQLDYLRREGYETITFGALYSALYYGTDLPDKPIILSFDDGHIDHYEVVYPILSELGYIGSFFVITGILDAGLAHYLSWEQVVEMSENGMDIQPHTKHHIDLRGRSWATLTYEIMGSYESVDYYVDHDIVALAYPVGRYDDAVLAFMESTTIPLAVTTRLGAWQTTTDAHILPRLRVTEDMGASGLAHLLGNTD